MTGSPRRFPGLGGWAGAPLFALALAACHGPQTPPGGGRPVRASVAAFVHGSVTGPDGRPVAGAQVVATVLVTSSGGTEQMGRCTGSRGLAVRTVTDAAGAYRQKLDMGAGPQFTGCLVVEVTPPEGSGLRPATASGATVGFVTEAPGTQLKEVRVDVSVPR